jgi:two-component system sensor histidine kinase RegB
MIGTFKALVDPYWRDTYQDIQPLQPIRGLMSDQSPGLFTTQERGSWVRLRTLIVLRWVAIAGQLIALIVAQRMYHLQLDLGLCYLTVGVSVIGNLIAIFVFPENKRLDESENFLMILFDLLQLSALLYLTGGLHNPFALLLLGPVTLAASIMSLRSTMLIGGTAIILATVLAEYHLPLRTEQGFILRIPDVFVFGNWAAIIIAIVFMGLYTWRISSEMGSMSDALAATQMALAREQKLTDLGGVVAAAAHELGTPLATIKLTSAELIEELADRPDLREDAALIRQQADRCRDILRDMGRAGKDDLMLRQAPLTTVIHEAADPHMNRGKDIHFKEGPGEGGGLQQPSILRKPEIVHGLRNLIQNAVDFARGNVWVESEWTDQTISVRILDDGRGFPPHLIGRIGDPFVRRRRPDSDRKARPGYEGMGLGLFIAKTLLERSGAQLSFANGSDPYATADAVDVRIGAVVKVIWPRDKIDAQYGENAIPLGLNRRIQI